MHRVRQQVGPGVVATVRGRGWRLIRPWSTTAPRAEIPPDQAQVLASLLRQHRGVALVGPPGAGKSALAQRVAQLEGLVSAGAAPRGIVERAGVHLGPLDWRR